MLRPLLAGLLSVLLIAGVIGLAVYSAREQPEPEPAAERVATPAPSRLPAIATRDLAEAAEAAGCVVERPRDEGDAHEPREFAPDEYRTNPPTSGTHFPDWAQDGIYRPGETPPLGTLVHTLEHGRINLQYAQGTPPAVIAQLEALYAELERGHHLLLYENATRMPFAVAATAWGHLLGCPTMNDRVFDALRAFRNEYVDKGPELIP